MKEAQRNFRNMSATYLDAYYMAFHFAWTLLHDSALRCEFYTLQTSELKHVTMASVQVFQSMLERCQSHGWRSRCKPRITDSMEFMKAI